MYMIMKSLMLKLSIFALASITLSACSKSFPEDKMLVESLLAISNPVTIPGGPSQTLSDSLTVSTRSSNGLNYMNLTSSIEITFNMSMDPSVMTVQAADGPCSMNIQFSTDSLFSNCIGGTIDGSGTSWTFTPAISIEEETLHYFRISSGIKSAAVSSKASFLEDYIVSYPSEDLPVLTDLVAWYKTNQNIYNDLPNGAAISSWNNSKSPANNMSNSLLNRSPEYLSSFRNGRAAVKFVSRNFDNFAMVNPSFVPPLEGASGFTVFLVFKADDVTRFADIFNITVNGSFHPRFRISNDAGSLALKTRKFDADPTDVVSTGNLNTNNYNIAAAYADYELNETGIFLEDGSAFSFSEKTAPAWDARGGTTCSNTPPRAFIIGNSGWWSPFDGSISDLIIYNVRLSKEEREAVVCFLGRKFNIAINNPSPCL